MAEPINNKSLWQLAAFLILVFAVLAIWAINLKSSWNANKLGSGRSSQSLAEITSDFSKTLDSIKDQINKQSDLLATATTTVSASSDSDKQADQAAFIEDLKQKINNNDLATTSTSTTDTTTITNPSSTIPDMINPGQGSVNCPQYINCMPTIDAIAPNCQIPVGCENITIIAY